jgi:hypothetical protein
MQGSFSSLLEKPSGMNANMQAFDYELTCGCSNIGLSQMGQVKVLY